MKEQKAFVKLKNIVDRMVTVPENEWTHFVRHLSERTFEKYDFLVRAGDVVKNFYFINKGLVRFFYGT